MVKYVALTPRDVESKRNLKKLKKVLKKVLTKGRQCDIILRSPRGSLAEDENGH